MAWAAPLTILIWVYAESEQQVTDAGQPISIEVKSRDPNKIVTLDRDVRSITCDLTGPALQSGSVQRNSLHLRSHRY